MIARLSKATHALRVARTAALSLALTSPLVSASAFAQSTDQAAAAPHLAEGASAAKASDWTKALAEYTAANNAAKSGAAQQGIALALYRLKRSGEAYDAYTELLSTYGNAISKADKTTAAARIKELAAQTGALTITVNEAGAAITVGDRALGTSPLLQPVRVSVGANHVRVTKTGFLPFAADVAIAENGSATVSATLERESTTGHLAVKEKTGQPLRVLVDGLDVGATPFEADLAPGPHDVSGRSSSLIAPTQRIELERGKRADVELVGIAQSGHLEIATSDHLGVLYVDGKVVGEGSFAGDLSVGPHTIAASREGFVRYEKTITLGDKQTLVETITLVHPGAKGVIEAPIAENEGIYGGFGLVGLFEPGGEGNELDNRCNGLGAFECKTPAPIGGALFGYVGYSWDPIGLELMLGGEFDQTSPKASFNGQQVSTENPLSIGIPREEQFHIYRGGGIAAARVRLQWQSKRVRGTIAGGAGVAYKEMLLTRTATATASDGSTPLENRLPPTLAHYVSPALSFDASVQLRLSERTAVSLGIVSWMESAEIGGSKATPALSNQYLGNQSSPQLSVPIATPAYHFATSAQIFVGPYLGMQFGP